ncbi:bacillithiol biosynthesis cysteine-adding enzyme BshC [Salimicrobium halophilum]|uniref:Putative cysteine ligase BshC n=1 Tax=Salimicrobium halophilum TaxID=86666 RepID=A0A1G8QGB4_9BACI|nr:bacillithiol biosynthesis cysteine-adding enzyme BshC [Salimicrobium halophilum]SDJ03731.1 bacillithiol biosynthesis cysteine-adding enzyme BshC [Salimicrobium halophilum]
MRIDPVQFEEKNTLMRDYRSHFEKIQNKFDYNPFRQDCWKERLDEIRDRSFHRTELSEVLKKMNEKYGAGEMTLAHIERLKEDDATVMIAGQQAGLLTGPLYTVNKAISVIEAAKQKERALGKPVLPVFWIAGEDHDFEEINHIYLNQDGLKKQKISQQTDGKTSVSDVGLDEDAAKNFIDDCFRKLPESKHTKEVYDRISNALMGSKTYTDFFARLLIALFKDQGLIVMDAHAPAIRHMEKDYFVQMIEHSEAIASGVYTREQENRRQGYPTTIGAEQKDAHLFYHEEDRRVLLVREGSRFVGKQGEVELDEDELLMIAEETPGKLSNNVVSRPLMQDLLLPVLGFIGGPGEISYWSALRPAFSELSIKMPPILPRLSFTFIGEDKRIASRNEGIDLYHVLRRGLGEEKIKYLASQTNLPLEEMREEAKREIARIHRPFQEEAGTIGPDIEAFAGKNLAYMESLVDELVERISKEKKKSYQKTLDFYREMENLLRPFGGLQERVWNPVPFLNEFGWNFFTEIPEYTWDFRQQHYLIYS